MKRDRPFLALVLLILVTVAVSQVACSGTAHAAPGLVAGDYCNDVGAKRVPWTTEAKHWTRDRVWLTLDALGVSPIIAAFHDAVVCRESFCGEASVRHTLGADMDGTKEDGLGTHGLSKRWHWGKWGPDADPGFCTPEVSTVVAHEIVWRAVTRFGASNLLEVQAVYAGAFDCSREECVFTLRHDQRRGICARMRERGYDCRAPISTKDLGDRLGDERREWALEQARGHVADRLGRNSSAP